MCHWTNDLQVRYLHNVRDLSQQSLKAEAYSEQQPSLGEKSIDNYHTIEKFELPTFPSLEWKRKIKLPLTCLDIEIDSTFLVVHLRHFD